MKTLSIYMDDHQYAAIAATARDTGYRKPDGSGDPAEFTRAVLGGDVVLVPGEAFERLALLAHKFGFKMAAPVAGIEPRKRKNQRRNGLRRWPIAAKGESE